MGGDPTHTTEQHCARKLQAHKHTVATGVQVKQNGARPNMRVLVHPPTPYTPPYRGAGLVYLLGAGSVGEVSGVGGGGTAP